MAIAPERIAEIQKMIQEAGPDKQQEVLQSLPPEELNEIMKMQCVYCKLASKSIPVEPLYEDDDFIAFLEIKPANPGHTIVMPKEHYPDLTQLPDDKAKDFFLLVKKLASAIAMGSGSQGLNIIQNFGQVAGQFFPHLTVNIIPRYEEDKLSFMWSPKQLEKEQFEEIFKRLHAETSKISLAGKKPVYDVSGKIIPEDVLKELESKTALEKPEQKPEEKPEEKKEEKPEEKEEKKKEEKPEEKEEKKKKFKTKIKKEPYPIYTQRMP